MRIHIDQFVNGRPPEVFARATDIESWPSVIRGIERIEVDTEGPVGVGTRFTETRIMFKKEASETMEITAFDPPHSYVVESHSCGADFHTTIRFHPEGDGTRIEMDMVTTATTLMAKLRTPVGLLFKGTMRKLIAKDFADIAAAFERDA
ncbi:MAG: SRPBCC family protein [Phycisphaerales bacterium]|nr:SRPBCC family protein [Phycisphaerales bacterium]